MLPTKQGAIFTPAHKEFTSMTTTATPTDTVKPARRISDRQRARAAFVQRISIIWDSLSPSFQAAWQKYHAMIGGNPRSNCFITFLTANESIVNSGSQPITAAPTAKQYPAPLPEGMQLVAVNSGIFSLQITGGTYTGRIVVYGAAPCLAGSNTYRPSAFKVIGSLNALPTTGTALAAMYAQAYRTPQAGEKVALKLEGVSASGLRTGTYFLAEPVFSTAAEAAAHFESDGEDSPEVSLHVG